MERDTDTPVRQVDADKMEALHSQYGYVSRSEYIEALLLYARNQADGSQAVPDYSEAFGGGSHEEYKMEKEFEKIVSGTEGVDYKDEVSFAQRACICTSDEAGHAADCPGIWLRTLNKQGNCFLYVHDITHRITGTRPPGLRLTVHLISSVRISRV
jgi:hypothetical protein